MKLEFQAKFLQYLNKKKQNEGFTLIELLVVIIIIGILAAIALPSFLNQANKAKQSEAKTYVGSMNRAQQAYYLENDEFTTNLGELGLGIKTQTTNYLYLIPADGKKDTKPVSVVNKAKTVKDAAPLRAYLGGVSLGEIKETSEATTLAILCEAEQAVGVGGDNATLNVSFDTNTGDPTCPNKYKPIGEKKKGAAG